MREKYNKEVIVSIIDTEGLDYAIRHYLNEDQIADSELAKLWKEAKIALDAIANKLDLDWV